MNGQERRVVHKLTGEELKEIKLQSIQHGVQLTLNVVYKAMKEEFGFGEKRLDKLEEAILNKIEEMGQ